MAGLQLGFTLRTSTNVKTVHLLGSWDGYKNQLPLSKDPSKTGGWRGTFRFQGSTLVPGKRYWYYYIMDGYHVSHDPAKPFTQEPTTGRSLNILDVPGSGGHYAAQSYTSNTVPIGRSLSPGKIVHPKPTKPYESRGLREADYSYSPVDDLAEHLHQTSLHYSKYSGSPSSSISSGSASSSSRGSTSPSSLSSLSDGSRGSSCHCNRFGITRAGQRVKIDCGGKLCGYASSSDESSSACSSDGEEEIRPRAGRPGAPQARPVQTTKARVVEAAPRRTGYTTSRRY